MARVFRLAPLNGESGYAFRYAAAVVACVATASVALPLRGYFDSSNIVMLFLLVVALTAWRCGAGPAVLAAFLSVALFDFFFVPPHFSFAVGDVQYLLTFVVMLCVALVIGQLTAKLRYAAQISSRRERQARALYEVSRKLSGVVTREQVASITAEFLGTSLTARAALLLTGPNDRLDIVPVSGSTLSDFGVELARAAFDLGEPNSFDDIHYFPLLAPMRIRGVLVVTRGDAHPLDRDTQDRVFETIASLVAIVVERLHYVQVASNALLRIESEQLRNSLLSALSHDLRTPLTALVGFADSLALSKPALSASQREMTEIVRDQTLRLSNLVHNLLDMARLQAGAVRLRKAWQPLEEVVGSSLKSLDACLGRHVVKTDVPADLPLIEFDAVLIERVLFNLIDNAVKYSPSDGEIAIAARRKDAWMEISVSDDGPGLPPSHESTVFEKFVRGHAESNTAGVGLGLAICRAIVEAHGGEIWATTRAEGGAEFVFTLPAGDPPVLDRALLDDLERDAS